MTDHEAGPIPPQRGKRKRVVLAGGDKPVGVLHRRTEVEQQTSMGELLVRNLIRAQLRAALGLGLLVVLVLAAVPALAWLWPGFARATILGAPVPWLLLAVLAFPLVLAAGWAYNRIAERNERDFVHMVEN